MIYKPRYNDKKTYQNGIETLEVPANPQHSIKRTSKKRRFLITFVKFNFSVVVQSENVVFDT